MSAQEELKAALERQEQMIEEQSVLDEAIERLEAAVEAEEAEEADEIEIVEDPLFVEPNVNITVMVNGQEVGSVEGHKLLGVVIQEFGAIHGLRTVVAFTGDGEKLTADQATQTLEDLNVTRLDIRTKDQRAEWHLG